MTIETTNAERAEWAKESLAVFTARASSGDHPDRMARNDLEFAVSELICNLIHYARQQAFNEGAILLQACGLFTFQLLAEEAK